MYNVFTQHQESTTKLDRFENRRLCAGIRDILDEFNM